MDAKAEAVSLEFAAEAAKFKVFQRKLNAAVPIAEFQQQNGGGRVAQVFELGYDHVQKVSSFVAAVASVRFELDELAAIKEKENLLSDGHGRPSPGLRHWVRGLVRALCARHSAFGGMQLSPRDVVTDEKKKDVIATLVVEFPGDDDNKGCTVFSSDSKPAIPLRRPSPAHMSAFAFFRELNVGTVAPDSSAKRLWFPLIASKDYDDKDEEASPSADLASLRDFDFDDADVWQDLAAADDEKFVPTAPFKAVIDTRIERIVETMGKVLVSKALNSRGQAIVLSDPTTDSSVLRFVLNVLQKCDSAHLSGPLKVVLERKPDSDGLIVVKPLDGIDDDEEEPHRVVYSLANPRFDGGGFHAAVAHILTARLPGKRSNNTQQQLSSSSPRKRIKK